MAPSAELRKLIKRRSTLKASIEAIKKFMDAFTVSSSHSIRQVSIRLTKLNDHMDAFYSIQDSILELDEEYEHEAVDEKERLQLEDSYYTLRAEMEDLIAKQANNDSTNSAPSSHLSMGDSIRLPIIQPPKFEGKLEDWSSFIDTFNALFHNNSSLNDVQRLHYLKSSVSGPAADIIKNFSITAENYTAAYEELVRQYENKGLTIQSHIRALLQSPKVITPSASELRQLHHHVASHLRALQALGQPVQYWDAWLVTLICGQLDPVTVGEWQLRQNDKELPTYATIESFLSKRVSAYEAGIVSNASIQPRVRVKNNNVSNNALFTRPAENSNYKCAACTESHKIFSCAKFNSLSIKDRKALVLSSRLCFNCLNSGHQVKDCHFSSCRMCGKKHNTKLHENSSNTPNVIESNPIVSGEQTVLYSESAKDSTSSVKMVVMLATSIITVFDKNGQPHQCRAVLDSGSQINFITNSCANKLGLVLTPSSSNISGVGAMQSATSYSTQATIASRFGDHIYKISLQSLPVIVNSLPSQLINRNSIIIPDHIKNTMADPMFGVPAPIDILIGSKIFFKILGTQQWPLNEDASLQESQFGWIITGELPILKVPCVQRSPVIQNNNSALSFFVSKSHSLKSDELKAEEHFNQTFTRNADGRFVVKLPLAQNPNVLGNSLIMAQKRFFNLERRFTKDSLLAKQYDEFMQEYISLGHMELSTPVTDRPTYYLPHHPVFKADSSTTKLRVVFDGSAESTTGFSLNDIMLKGPKLQPDIYNILLRFRLHQVALTADVAKMYRQVLVDTDDCYLQRIVYRKHPDEPLKHYNLKTVTYGTKAASFLSTRCLAQLGQQHSETSIGKIICNDFYVDDLISGGKTDQECFKIYEQLQSVLGSAGFSLRKWCSSSSQLLSCLTTNTQEDPNFMVKLSEEDVVSTLGLSWQPSVDAFRFIMKKWTPPQVTTKRSLLSNINSIYDPIGFISAVLIKGKIFIQQLWSLKMDWDQALSEELCLKWIKFYSSLANLDQLIIPRLVIMPGSTKYEIHGFCDASQHAFGACVYIRSITNDQNYTANLYTSRSRVAPAKATTIPRLELCGALLLAELVTEVTDELKRSGITVPKENIYLWTDSTIVLAWINSLSVFQVYVSNRIARINDLSCTSQWHHTPTTSNPADLISRGIEASSIITCKMWWHGPGWLSGCKDKWPSNPIFPTVIPEVRPVKLVLATITNNYTWLLKRYSNWFTLLRITALLYRFLFNCKAKKSNCIRRVDFISLEEMTYAKNYLIAQSQAESFAPELSSLKAGRMVHRGSCLKTLSPFLDDQGLIRVGGRLHNSSINYQAKHPLVLSAKSVVTKLIFNYEHRRLLHIGPQGLLAHISTCYWIVRGRTIARKTITDCVQCFRSSPRFTAPFMAPLPRERVTIERPFARTGMDYGGPIMVRSGIRKVTPIKSYICVFVCMTTRAIHLELVASLSTQDFLATLSRFMSRRGQCSSLYSDNGSNFVGANRVLNADYARLKSDKKVNDFLTSKEIKWHFIPPSAPHFGGLWESAIKSAKKQLIRVTKGVLLTYDETTTMLCKVEAALNSRPLFPMSNDPTDFNVLTPGHFLVGGPIMLPPEPDVSAIPQNRLHRFKLMQKQIQVFWKRWVKEYLPQVQRRGKWTTICRNAAVGDLCILKDDTLPLTHWPLVRITQIHPGADNVVRVVTVRNSAGMEYKRPMIKLALLPTEEDELQDFKIN